MKALAQLGATLGREFSYELLQAVSLWDEGTLQRGLHQLVEAEFLYQRGLPPQATYVFKHVLIQEAAYQSLLRSTRQQYHQRIAQVLEARIPRGLSRPSPSCWRITTRRQALNAQAISYLAAGGPARRGALGLCRGDQLTSPAAWSCSTTLPETRERIQQELSVQMIARHGIAGHQGRGAREVEQAYTHARELCQQIGEPDAALPRPVGALVGVYNARGELPDGAGQLGEQLLSLAQRLHDPDLLLEAHHALWTTLFCRGDLAAARAHQEQGMPSTTRSSTVPMPRSTVGTTLGCAVTIAQRLTLWLLGYPDQARGQQPGSSGPGPGARPPL